MTNKNSSKRILGFLFGLWKISPILCWSMVIVQVIFAVLTTTIAPIFVSQLLTHIADGTATLNSSIGILGGYALVLFIGDVVAIRFTIAMAFISETKMQSAVSTRVFEHLSSKSLGFHANKMSGGIVSDAGKLSGSIERFWDTLTFTAVPIVTTIVSVCVALSFVLWPFAIAIGLLSVVIILIITKSQTAIAPISQQVAEKSSAMTAYFADAISNIAAVKAFAREESELNKYQDLIKNWRQTNVQEMKKVLVITGTFGVMMTIMNVCAFVAAILATEYHVANIGVIYLVISYTLNVVSSLWEVSHTTRNYIRILGDAGPMINTLDDAIDLVDPKNPAECTIHDGKVEFNKISFTHKENSRALFDNFSLVVKAGERIGLVGKSGSGKTSLTRLLLRFSDVDSGQIIIDGQNIKSITQNDLHRAIAYVPQEPMLFHRSLRENIAYGKPDAAEDEIFKVAEQANIIDFIKNLPKGLGTTVGERGVKLSGGQRQRIAIARAMLKDAPILVLDEATSALDSENEKLIQDALWELMKGRTSIVIAHRLSTIARLDRIIVLDNGKIVEQGSHAKLLANNGIYAKLWAHQSGGFLK
jgi:ATP-binding cassette, subfamily B, bacterial